MLPLQMDIMLNTIFVVRYFYFMLLLYFLHNLIINYVIHWTDI